MVKQEIGVVINRPIADVFAYVSDPRNNPKWQEGLKSTRLEPDGPITVGSRVTDERSLLGMKIEATAEVTALEPPKRFAIKSVSGPFPFQMEAAFEEASGGTQITFHMQMEASGFFKLAEGKVAGTMKETLGKSFETLKTILES